MGTSTASGTVRRAYVSLLSGGEAYAPGVEALGASLRASGSREARVLMVTPDVPSEVGRRLERQGWLLRPVEPIANPHGHEMLFERFEAVFTKLRAWDLAELDKVVYLDGDTIVLQNVDDLFERPDFSAAPDFFVPDRFNSGVMVLEPSARRLAEMLKALHLRPSYDGGDQGFLNSFFPEWNTWPVEHRLPPGYNMHHFIYQFLVSHPTLSELDREARILHYTLQKPWLRPTFSGGAAVWWEMYYRARPEHRHFWKQPLHGLEDRSFDLVVRALSR